MGRGIEGREPTPSGLSGVDDNDDVLTRDAAAGLAGDMAAPLSGKRSVVGACECGDRRNGADRCHDERKEATRPNTSIAAVRCTTGRGVHARAGLRARTLRA